MPRTERLRSVQAHRGRAAPEHRPSMHAAQETRADVRRFEGSRNTRRQRTAPEIGQVGGDSGGTFTDAEDHIAATTVQFKQILIPQLLEIQQVSRWIGPSPEHDHIKDLLDAADAWCERYFMTDGSLFGDEAVWTCANIQDLPRRVIEDPIEGHATS